VPPTSCAQSELECFCGTLGVIGQSGVPIEVDPVRGSFIEQSANRIPKALPRGKKSPRQRQQAAVSPTHSTAISASWDGSLPGAIRWAAQVLCARGSMSGQWSRGQCHLGLPSEFRARCCTALDLSAA
jgi:hypothetical protein